MPDRLGKIALFAAAIFASGAPLFLGGCYSVPVTGRSSLNLVSDQEVRKMSIKAFEDMKHHYPISHDPQENAMLQRVGERLSKVVFWDMPDADWEFVVFKSPQINAFAMAGGKVGVFSGMFKICRTDAELAAVVAHEIGHVVAKHINERLSQTMMAQAGGVAVGVATGGQGMLTQSAIMDAYGLGTGLSSLSFDRKKELEADHIGLMFMARAGYDPMAAETVMERLDDMTAKMPAPPPLLATHPATPDRLMQLMKLMPEAEKIYKSYGKEGPVKIIK